HARTTAPDDSVAAIIRTKSDPPCTLHSGCATAAKPGIQGQSNAAHPLSPGRMGYTSVGFDHSNSLHQASNRSNRVALPSPRMGQRGSLLTAALPEPIERLAGTLALPTGCMTVGVVDATVSTK